MKAQEQIKKNILQVMACGGEVRCNIYIEGAVYSYEVGIMESNGVINVAEAVAPFCGESKPIFHRLSSLTESIVVDGYNDGAEFVPLIKLFELSCDSDYVDYYGGFEDYKLQIDDGWNHCLTFTDILGDDLSFCFGLGSFSLMIDTDVLLLSNQQDMFDQLHAWGFFTGDQSLFDTGEIIDKLKHQ